jgi:hypothetical protein
MKFNNDSALFLMKTKKEQIAFYILFFSYPSWDQFCKTFYVRDKLERLLLVSLTSLDYSLRVRSRAYPRVDHVKGSSL